MSRYATKWFAVAAILITMGAVAALSRAAEAELGLSNAWVRPTLGAGRTTAAYVTIANMGTAADRLMAAETPGAGSVEIHTSGMEDGVMRMRRLEGLDIPPGKTITMAPGGFHIMLIDMEEPVQVGTNMPLTLIFESAGSITVEAEVSMTPPASTGSSNGDTDQDVMHHEH